MRIGAHISAAGGLWNAAANAAALGCETFQMFSRPPQGGAPPPLTETVVKKFRDACAAYGFDDFVIHAPYFINLASSLPRIRHSSIAVLRDELERGSTLGARYLMTHLGSAKDVGETEALKMVIEAVKKITDGYRGSCKFLIEISAGSGMVIGDTFEEIAAILDAVDPTAKQLGVCFDTQHAFASGYDLRTPAALDETIFRLEKTIGLERVVMSHCNDSKVGLGEHKDRHEHIGDGHIGLAAFRAIVNHPKLQHWLLILETPWDDQRRDIDLVKKLRDTSGKSRMRL